MPIKISKQNADLLNDIINFALVFEFCDFEQYGDLDDDTMLEKTQQDIRQLKTLLTNELEVEWLCQLKF